MSLENTHKLMGLYGGFNARRYTIVHAFCFFKLYPIGCIGLIVCCSTCESLKHTCTVDSVFMLKLHTEVVGHPKYICDFTTPTH